MVLREDNNHRKRNNSNQKKQKTAILLDVYGSLYCQTVSIKTAVMPHNTKRSCTRSRAVAHRLEEVDDVRVKHHGQNEHDHDARHQEVVPEEEGRVPHEHGADDAAAGRRQESVHEHGQQHALEPGFVFLVEQEGPARVSHQNSMIVHIILLYMISYTHGRGSARLRGTFTFSASDQLHSPHPLL